MRIVIIGSSAASKSAIETMQRYGDDLELIVITKDDIPYYSRVLLPNFLAGHLTKEALIFYQLKSVEGSTPELIKSMVTRVESSHKKVILEDGGQVGYDKLLICSGASPSILLPEGNSGDTLRGVYNFRNIEDISKIRELLPYVKECLVVGGGLVGLKAAVALNSVGKHVTIIHRSSQLLSTFMDRQGSEMAHQQLHIQGIETLLSDTIEEYETDQGQLSGVRLKSGKRLDAQLIIWAAGVSPNTDFLRLSGIRLDNGVCVDRHMETNIEGIFAAGDVVRGINLLTEEPDNITLWTDATLQGKIAAWNILGMRKTYAGGVAMNSVVFNGIPFITMGIIRDADIQQDQVFTSFNQDKGVYRKVVIRDHRIIGAVFVGDVRYAGMVNWDLKSKKSIENGEKYVNMPGLEAIYREHHAELMSNITLMDGNKGGTKYGKQNQATND